MIWKSYKLCLRLETNIWSSSINHRSIYTSGVLSGKRNFRKFPIPNKRGQFEHNRLPKELLEKEFDYPVFRDTLLVRYPGYWFGKKLYYVKEMEPELVVPDLKDFELKPYVSYRCPQIQQSEFTARDLFNATLADNIIEKFRNNEEIDVTVNEQQIESSKIKAKQTGADLFIDNSDFGVQQKILSVD